MLIFNRLRYWVVCSALILSAVVSTHSVQAKDLAAWVNDRPVLSKADVERYREVFRLQSAGLWWKANQLIKKIENPILMGHVDAQRYLHPTKYRARYPELETWLKKYRDHPQAGRIYQLAEKRKYLNSHNPPKPRYRSFAGPHKDPLMTPEQEFTIEGRSSAQDRRAKGYAAQIKNAVCKGALSEARRLLGLKSVQKALDPAELDEAKGYLALSYFYRAKDDAAFELANPAGMRSGEAAPHANWAAGLAAWRLEKLTAAREHFAYVAKSPYATPWLRSAGAYWAARAHLRTKKPEGVNRWLNEAKKYPRTFYGLLATRALGHTISFNWQHPNITDATADKVFAGRAGQRLRALLQIGAYERAATELRSRYHVADEKGRRLLRAVASMAGMARLAMQLDTSLALELKHSLPAAAYPVPTWQPANGWSVDKALVYALMRQESHFNPRATSHVGARGLMQLMPATASFIARNAKYEGRGRDALYDPALNLHLAQKYMSHLLDYKPIDGNLFLAITAWNAGPGNVRKWQRRNHYNDDPLLFIESIPVEETRVFVERVFANLWMYRSRFNQPTPTLDAIAAGNWPIYVAYDNKAPEVAFNAAR